MTRHEGRNLGTGGIAARHADAAQAAGLTLAAACGRDQAKTAAFADRFGMTAYSDFGLFLDYAELDLLIVALPPYAHSGQVEAAAAAGIHLLVEKPIALDLPRGS